MSQTALASLNETLGRQLLAGGPVKAALAPQREPVAALAAQVPSLAPLANQVDLALSSGKAGDVLALALLNGQVQRSLARPEAAGEKLAPLPQAEPVPTPLAAYDLVPLLRALTTSGEGRVDVVRQAVAGGRLKDLRLLLPSLQALTDPNLAPILARDGLVQFGAAAVKPLQDAFSAQGGSADGYRLVALARLQGAGAEALVRQALDKGSTDVQAGALEALSLIALPEARGLALKMLRDKNPKFWPMASRVLALFDDDESLDALLAAFDDDTCRMAVKDAVGQSRHPRAGRRLLERLEPDFLAGLTTDWEDPVARRNLDYALTAIFQLGLLRCPEALPMLKQLWLNHPIANLRVYAATALRALDPPGLTELLLAGLDNKQLGQNWHNARLVSIKTAMDLDAAGVFDHLAPFLQPDCLIDQDGSYVAGQISGELLQHASVLGDPRWLDLFWAILKDDRSWQSQGATVGDVVKLLNGKRQKEQLKDYLLQRLEASEHDGNWNLLYSALKTLDDPSSAAPIRAWATRHGIEIDSAKTQLYWLLSALERKRK